MPAFLFHEAMLIINDKICISDEYLNFSFARSSGPGGQNVNKVNTQAQLRFTLNDCPELNSHIKNRLQRIAARYLLANGDIQITSQQHRSQGMNRQDCLDKLADLIRKSLVRPKPRIATKPTAASKRKRLDNKKKRADIKQKRSKIDY